MRILKTVLVVLALSALPLERQPSKLARWAR